MFVEQVSVELPEPSRAAGDGGLQNTPIGMEVESETIVENWLSAETVMIEFTFLPISVAGGFVAVIVKSANLNVVVVECASGALVPVKVSV